MEHNDEVERLACLLRDWCWETGVDAPSMLGDWYPDPLLDALNNWAREIRVPAARALGKASAPQVVDVLMDALLIGPRFEKNLADLSVAERLARVLNNGDWITRVAVARALGSLGTRRTTSATASQLSDQEVAVRQEVIVALRKLGRSESLRPVLSLLEDVTESTLVEVADELGRTRDPGSHVPLTRPLAQLLIDRNLYVRSAAHALGGLDTPASVSPLVSALVDKALLVRLSAVRGLRWLRNSRAVVPLVAMLRDCSVLVRAEAARALGDLGDPYFMFSESSPRRVSYGTVLKPLLKTLRDRSPFVRVAADQAMGNLAAREWYFAQPETDENPQEWVISPLVGLLSDHNDSVRSAAVEALAVVADCSWVFSKSHDRGVPEEILAALVACLSDDSGSVRLKGAEVIREIGEPDMMRSVAALLEAGTPEVQLAAAVALTRIQDSGATQVLLAMRGASSESIWDNSTRCTVAKALGESGDPCVAGALSMLALEDCDPHVRQVARETLWELPGPWDVGRLLDGLFASDSAVREAAVAALRDLRAAWAMTQLVAALQEMDERERNHVIDALVMHRVWHPRVINSLKETFRQPRSQRVS